MVSSKQNAIQGMLVFKSLPWLVIETYVLKLSIYFFRFVAILCAKMFRGPNFVKIRLMQSSF